MVVWGGVVDIGVVRVGGAAAGAALLARVRVTRPWWGGRYGSGGMCVWASGHAEITRLACAPGEDPGGIPAPARGGATDGALQPAAMLEGAHAGGRTCS